MSDRPVVILVTGSRNWIDEQKIRDVLERFRGRFVLVIHGAAPGADTIAHRVAEALGYWIEPHPADWRTHGKKAGMLRNADMVARLVELSAADYECHVFAFPLPGSRGTWNCVHKAEAAGFEVEMIRD
jgi:hypothetical protein